MNVSTMSRPARKSQPLSRASAPQRLIEFDVPLPSRLEAFGESVKASLCGSEGAPIVVALGGISADRFPLCRPERSPGWWPGLVGDGCAVDPGEFRILGLDFAADERGELAPSTEDQAAIICVALDEVGEDRARAIVGASYGGMAALALGQHFPERTERLVVISAGAEPHPSATAVRELQRRIVALGLAEGRGAEALSIARGLAMLTYRTPDEFELRFAGGIDGTDVLTCSEPGAYLRARGDAYSGTMSPQRFLSLSASIDRHRIDPQRIHLPTLVIGAQSDQLVLPKQSETLARHLAGPAELHLLPSLYGHDMFLKEAVTLSGVVGPFLRRAA